MVDLPKADGDRDEISGDYASEHAGQHEAVSGAEAEGADLVIVR